MNLAGTYPSARLASEQWAIWTLKSPSENEGFGQTEGLNGGCPYPRRQCKFPTPSGKGILPPKKKKGCGPCFAFCLHFGFHDRKQTHTVLLLQSSTPPIKIRRNYAIAESSTKQQEENQDPRLAATAQVMPH